ncbi:MAG: hypothetical protein C0424_04915 [Sphingobacteriaceae bacterium]|nr:hypothetical protein [Sphingobacteriaceae bacterium]
MNTYKPKNETREQQTERAPKSGRRINLFGVFDPERYLKAQAVGKHLPFVLYCSVLTLLYIANAHMVEKRIRSINKLENELKDLRAEYISLKSDLMYLSKQSEVAKRVEVAGLKELQSAPKKIYID